MWHIFGPVVRWPLHSPLRLLGVIAAAITVIMVLGAVNDRGSAPTPAAAGSTPAATPTADPSTEPARPVTAAPAPTPTPLETPDGAGVTAGGTDAFSSDPAVANPVLAAQQAAADFVAAWARPDLDAPSWQAGLAPHATPDLLRSLADTDPANVPAVTVSGQPVQVAANAEAGVFDVPTTGEFVRVHVQLIDGTWLATDVEPAA